MIQTNNLPLKKHEGTDSASDMLDYANDNMDTINAALGAKLSTLATTAKTLVGAINESMAGYATISSSNTNKTFTVTGSMTLFIATAVVANDRGGIWTISLSGGNAYINKIGASAGLSLTSSGNQVTFNTDGVFYRLSLQKIF